MDSLEETRELVRVTYDRYGLSLEYDIVCSMLHDLYMLNMAKKFRIEYGLTDKEKTPYC